MDPVGAIVVFIISWWLSFLAALPIGVRSQLEDGDVAEGTEEGAPAEPMLRKKVIWATISAVILTLIVGVLIVPWLEGV